MIEKYKLCRKHSKAGAVSAYNSGKRLFRRHFVFSNPDRSGFRSLRKSDVPTLYEAFPAAAGGPGACRVFFDKHTASRQDPGRQYRNCRPFGKRSHPPCRTRRKNVGRLRRLPVRTGCSETEKRCRRRRLFGKRQRQCDGGKCPQRVAEVFGRTQTVDAVCTGIRQTRT
ncbi:Uncharacterised protein [Neisseria meningitidis]|nr:Uncharacterised protein [Neisseria meningitidis]